MFKHFSIITGSSSPHIESQIDIYRLLSDESSKRKITSSLIDFVGCGQYPDYGEGLELYKNANIIKNRLSEVSPKSILFARCYGTYVVSYILSHEPKFLQNYQRVVLWAPIPIPIMHDDVMSYGSIENYNAKMKKAKGFALNSNFFKNIKPISELAPRFPVDKEYVLMCGSDDKLCKLKDIDAIIQSIPASSKMSYLIKKAKHGVSNNDPIEIVSCYLSRIFD